MPEGDTIFRAARTLHHALAGELVTRFESVLPALTRVDDDAPLKGRTVERVHSIGKHLLMHFSGGLVLRTHMRMNGSWHIYRVGERWRRPRRDMRIVVSTARFEAVAFNVPVAEFVPPKLSAKAELRRLGPDLLSETFDEDEAVRRFREHPDAAIADALIDQRIVAGAGNIYKSEVLFLCGIDPFSRVGDVTDQQLHAIVRTARRLLRVNAAGSRAGIRTYGGLRSTVGRSHRGDRLWVYARARKPCRRCGTAIAVKATGLNARLTYWCAKCQPRQG
ncbi:MAG TPA: DNA-formamidopyrimidine glycosylase family protein [Vicinamibacterales bacterium]|nr:DNA-formamidopyrimidine glycosylase family protein [Vicinamibacterales bacterium]